MPNLLVQIMGFMIRYLDVVTDEMGRMKVARESRGFRASTVRHWPILARSSGALFIRSYERARIGQCRTLEAWKPRDSRATFIRPISSVTTSR